MLRALLFLLGVLAALPVLAQVPNAPGTGKAPVPNVRAALPPPGASSVMPSAAPAPSRSAAASENTPPAPERELQGAMGVGRVVDGDTVRVEGRTFRLWGIDAPELIQVCQRDGQSYGCGREAASYLRSLLSPGAAPGESATVLGAAQIICTPRASDQYGRTAALCTLGDMDLGAEMVRAGWAVVFARHGTDYTAQEADARDSLRGLWAGSFDAPWDWRAKKLGE
jgi:endonuclease YncB( thermonuclease family)